MELSGAAMHPELAYQQTCEYAMCGRLEDQADAKVQWLEELLTELVITSGVENVADGYKLALRQEVFQKLLAVQSMIFVTVHIHHLAMESRIRTPGATWCFCLLPGAANQWHNLQGVQPAHVQSALLLHIVIPLQQEHGGSVYLRRILPTAPHPHHCTSDLVWYLVSSPITTPWDPGVQL